MKSFNVKKNFIEEKGEHFTNVKKPVAVILDIAHCFKTENQKNGPLKGFPQPLLIWDSFHNCESRMIIPDADSMY